MDSFLGAGGIEPPVASRECAFAPRPRALIVVGTRPEVVKLAPVFTALTEQDVFDVAVCNTGQHGDLVDPICRLFGLPVRYDLRVMPHAQGLAYLAGAVTQKLGAVIAEEKPSVCIVQGDTTSALAGALAGFHHRIPVAHVEAGLRTGDMDEPWPEEANRVLITRLSRLHFAPTPAALAALTEEGVERAWIYLTGNTVVDAVQRMRRQIKERAPAVAKASDEPLVLFTMHRRESFGEPMRKVFMAVRRLAMENPVQIVFPVHPNRRVREPAEALLGGLPNVRLLPPLAYDEMIRLLDDCRFVITDSGGLIEEAPAFGKPVLIVRQTTERQEAVMCGGAALCGYDGDKLLDLAETLLRDSALYRTMAAAPNPFGDGRAGQRIARALAEAAREGQLAPACATALGRLS